MATHGTLRNDFFDVSSIYDEEVEVLVPGPSFPENPRDYSRQTLRFPNAESIREVLREQHKINQVGTLGHATGDSDTIYNNLIYRSNVLYAANPDDPANPTAVLSGTGATAQKVIWGIDPDGGHTLDASGTTLTLTLKVTKYTFDALNFVSAVDADVSVVYNTGTECA
jgi:hypothetical protein